MSPARREQLLARYEVRSRVFDVIAAERETRFGPSPQVFPPVSPGDEPVVVPPVPSLEKGLSEREIDVVALVAKGMSNTQIGSRLGISEETVKSHVQHSHRKLHARNRAHAVAIAISRGLVPAATRSPSYRELGV